MTNQLLAVRFGLGRKSLNQIQGFAYTRELLEMLYSRRVHETDV
jgi:hypothetical protein